jgi:hypothetical protein
MARRSTALVLALVTAVAAAFLAAGPSPLAPSSLADRIGPLVDGAVLAAGLEHATSCDELTTTLVALAVRDGGAARSSGWGAVEETAADASVAGDAAVAPTAGATADTTNVQEPGVDEPDVVERMGDLVVTGFGGMLRTLRVEAGVPRLVGELDLAPWGRLGLLAVGPDRVVALASVAGDTTQRLAPGGDIAVHPGSGGAVQVSLVDVADPARPVEVSRLRIDGDLAAARAVDGVLRLALRSGVPYALPVAVDAAWDAGTATDALRATTVGDWLPQVVSGLPSSGTTTDQLVACDRVGLPSEHAGLGTLTMAVVDATADELAIADAEAVVASGETLYANADRLVVATTSWSVGPLLDGPAPAPALVDPALVDPPAGVDPALVDPPVEPLPVPELPVEPGGEVLPVDPPVELVLPPGPDAGPRTELHVFDVDGLLVDHVATGSVEGRLVNQFAMSIHEGVLRTAVTTGGWGGTTQSSVITHRVEGTALVELGRVDGLGPDEDIQSVRYLGDTAYVVTFRRTDPLYVVDLGDPAAPRTLGELKVEGYSAYLHPLGGGRLLGIGQDADPTTGITRGLQLSTFDVADPTRPTRLDVAVEPDSASVAEWDHHAVTVTSDGLVAVPIERWSARGSVGLGALLARVGVDGGITRVGVLSVGDRWEQAPQRVLLVDGVVLTLAEGGATTWDLDALTPVGSVMTPVR